jgi:hypothetical protein
MLSNPEVRSMPIYKGIAFATLGALGLGWASGNLSPENDETRVHSTSVGEAMIVDMDSANKVAGLCLLELQIENCPPQPPPEPEKDLKDLVLEKLPPVTTTTVKPAAKPAAQKPAPAPKPVAQPESQPPPSTTGGQKEQWMAEAGIQQQDYGYVDYIFSKESGWRPDAVSSNSCIGLGQNCPDKSGNYWLDDSCPDWKTNIVCQIRRFAEYAQRWGGWAGSYNHKRSTGWW